MHHISIHTLLLYSTIIGDIPKISTVSYGSFRVLILKTVYFSENNIHARGWGFLLLFSLKILNLKTEIADK
jgi:hypothetical protein